MFSYRPPGISVRDGRTFAKSLNSSRRRTFAERCPPPDGVSRGPLSARRVRRMLASVAAGSASPDVLIPRIPATCVSQSNRTPSASRAARVASTISGPIPSPGINVAGIRSEGIFLLSRVEHARRFSTVSDPGSQNERRALHLSVHPDARPKVEQDEGPARDPRDEGGARVAEGQTHVHAIRTEVAHLDHASAQHVGWSTGRAP